MLLCTNCSGEVKIETNAQSSRFVHVDTSEDWCALPQPDFYQATETIRRFVCSQSTSLTKLKAEMCAWLNHFQEQQERL